MYINSASLDITYRCNLHCRHCYNFSGVCPFPEMDDSQLHHVALELGSHDFSSICLCGGEPLCRKDALLMVARTIKERNPSTALSMVSNGLLWNEDIAREIYDSGVRTVQFSLDGFTEESYDFVRQSGGQLKKVFRTIEISLQQGFDVMVSTLPHRKSLREFPAIIQYCEKVGVSEIRVQPLMPLGRGEENYKDLCLTEEEYEELSEMLDMYKNTSKIRVTWGDPIDHFFMYQEEGRIPQVAVNAYGEILVSPYLPISIWDLKSRALNEYLDLRIDECALRHPIVRKCLEDIMEVKDLTSRRSGLPELFLEQNLNIQDELLSETARKA